MMSVTGQGLTKPLWFMNKGNEETSVGPLKDEQVTQMRENECGISSVT